MFSPVAGCLCSKLDCAELHSLPRPVSSRERSVTMLVSTADDEDDEEADASPSRKSALAVIVARGISRESRKPDLHPRCDE